MAEIKVGDKVTLRVDNGNELTGTVEPLVPGNKALGLTFNGTFFPVKNANVVNHEPVKLPWEDAKVIVDGEGTVRFRSVGTSGSVRWHTVGWNTSGVFYNYAPLYTNEVTAIGEVRILIDKDGKAVDIADRILNRLGPVRSNWTKGYEDGIIEAAKIAKGEFYE